MRPFRWLWPSWRNARRIDDLERKVDQIIRYLRRRDEVATLARDLKASTDRLAAAVAAYRSTSQPPQEIKRESAPDSH